MSDKRIIAVVGATGAQGGGLVRAILNSDNNFAVRAITRDSKSTNAKQLTSLGAEVVQADVDDVISLTKAFEGVYGVFGITFFCIIFHRSKN